MMKVLSKLTERWWFLKAEPFILSRPTNTTGSIHVKIKSEVQGEAITDLLIFATPDYEVSKMYSGDVEIKVCYTEKSKKWGQRIPDLAVDIVSFYRMYFGFFPYQRVTFIAGRTDITGGGEAAPGILWIHSMFKMGEGTYAKQILAHEIAHLYWGSIGYVRIVQPYLGWLSLGLGLWTDRKYTDHAGLGRSFHERQISKYLSKVKEGKDTIPLSSPKVRA